LVLSLTVDLVGLQEAAEAVRQLQPSAARRIIHCFVNVETLIEMRNLSSGRWRFCVSAADGGSSDALRLIGRTLWPEAAWLKVRHGRATLKVRVWHLQAQSGEEYECWLPLARRVPPLFQCL
jgi:hypothetical protein